MEKKKPVGVKNPNADVKVPKRTVEQKAAKFKEIAETRTVKAIRSIDLIGNLSSANYVSSKEQVDKILAALKGSIASLESKFASPGAVARNTFSL